MQKRNYRKEYDNYHASKEQKENRAKRNSARTIMEKKHGASALKNKDIDHKIPLSKGGGNNLSNLRIKSKSSNRSFTRNAKGGIKK